MNKTMDNKFNFVQKLEMIRIVDDKIFENNKKVIPLILKLIETKKIPKTIELFSMYMNNTSFLKNGIFDSLESDNLYTSKVLFRSLIEHYLRFLFVYFNYLSDKDDTKSEHYYIALEISEFLAYNKPLNIMKGKNITTATLNNEWDNLCIEYPALSKYSKKEILLYSKQLSIRNIIKFINEQVGVSKNTGYVLLPNMISEYSKLSSYVHGGIFALHECDIYSDKKKRDIEKLRLGQLTFQLTGQIKLLSYWIMYPYEKQLENVYLNTEKLIKEGVG